VFLVRFHEIFRKSKKCCQQISHTISSFEKFCPKSALISNKVHNLANRSFHLQVIGVKWHKSSAFKKTASGLIFVCSLFHGCGTIPIPAFCPWGGMYKSYGVIARAATSEKFRGGKVSFGNYYDVIDVQSTMMRLFCYEQLTSIGGRTFFIVGGHGRPQGGIGICSPW